MSRLDHQILAIRNKLMLGVFLEALANAGLLLGVVVVLAVVAERVLDRDLAHAWMLFWIGVGAAGVASFIYSFRNRPSAKITAMKIDDVLGLKEKFSTALYVRPTGATAGDEFVRAAVLDAERTAQNVSVHHRFPLKFPRRAIATGVVFLIALLTALLMPTFHLFSKPPADQVKVTNSVTKPHANDFIKQEMPKILAPAALPDSGDAIKRATADLDKAVHTDDGDELHNQRSVLSALQNYNKAMTEELDKNEKFQTAVDEKNQMSALASAKDDSTPIGKAQNEIKSGDLDAAMNDISKAVNNFDKAKPEDQQKMLEQAQQLAQELSKAANDPRVGQKVAQQLMQMGASQAQAQQLSATMQQAAQGNKQAQQQLQQQAQQMAQQMNNGKGPTQQQQQQIQSLMSKAQGLANSQAQAQAMSSAAQQLANSMAQAHAAQSSSSHQGHSGSQSSRQGQGQSQPQGQPSPGSGQGMAAAQQQMQQQLQNMQANAKDAQAMQAAAAAAAQAAADAAAGLGSSGGDPNGSGNDPNQGQGQNPQANNGNKPGLGNGGPGPGGAKMPIAVAPYTFKQEIDPSRDITTGKILASRYVKAGIDKGKSIAGTRDVAASAEKDATDDIEQDRIPREAQEAEKDYFSAMQNQGQ